MVNCPRCQQPVDNTARATCPACFAPMPPPAIVPVVPPMPVAARYVPPAAGAGFQAAAPTQPGFVPSPSATGYQAVPPVPPLASPRNGRMALTGEIVETSAPLHPSAYAPQSAPVRPGYAPQPSGGLPDLPDYIARTAPPGRSKSPSYVPPGTYRGSSGMSSYMQMRLAIAGVGLIICLFAYVAKAISGTGNAGSPAGASPFGGFTFGGSPNPEAASLRTPESGAQSAMQALRNRDWHKLYYVCAFESNERKSASEADDFQRELGRAAAISHNPLTLFNLMAASTQFSTGPATVHGNTADVQTLWTIPYDGETISLRGAARMIRQNGAWQLNFIGSGSPLDHLLGSVTSRTGHGPAIVIPHFGPFAPHNMPSMAPPEMRPPASSPYTPQPGNGAGSAPGNNPGFQPGNQPGYAPPMNIPGPRFTPGPHFAPGPSMNPGPKFIPGPRYGPGAFPRGPRFGPPSMPGGPNGGINPPGGMGGSTGAFGRPDPGAQSPDGPPQ